MCKINKKHVEPKTYDYISVPFNKGDKKQLVEAINKYNETVPPDERITSISKEIRIALIIHLSELGIKTGISARL